MFGNPIKEGKCRGTLRFQCLSCGKSFDLCPHSPHWKCICPYCNGYFVSANKSYIREVPWWYGRPVLGWIEVVWGEKHGLGPVAIIPEFYLDVHIYLAGEKGKNVTREEALQYFQNHSRNYWGRDIKVIDNEEWQEKRKDHNCYF